MLSLDITDRKQIEDALSAIAQGVSAATGELFLRVVVASRIERVGIRLSSSVTSKCPR